MVIQYYGTLEAMRILLCLCECFVETIKSTTYCSYRYIKLDRSSFAPFHCALSIYIAFNQAYTKRHRNNKKNPFLADSGLYVVFVLCYILPVTVYDVSAVYVPP